ncbi:uncharacterized protein LOC134246611 [Saccostrea cucullata]|uniref:uncharacterized protein LOC134246611 n=1 Tax=Saccostrea cuccullata TaxID=36930 RepID=UPI002ED61A85
MRKRKKSFLHTAYVFQAKLQRDYYRHQCTTSKEAFVSLPEKCKQTRNAPCSVDMEMHYSWDYAQQVHFPHHAQQVGPIFFKTPQKCNVFGVCCESSGLHIIVEYSMMVEGHIKFDPDCLLEDKNILPSLNDPLPQEIPAPGLEPKRQWYLYEEIREHCLLLSAKDTSCPKLVVSKKEVKVYSPDHSTSHLGKRKILLIKDEGEDYCL